MSGYILCQVKRAKLPYYIENISTNIYSIEELCFYFYHNIYLLDSTILNEELCFWIRDQLGLKKLAENLYKHLDDDEMKVEIYPSGVQGDQLSVSGRVPQIESADPTAGK